MSTDEVRPFLTRPAVIDWLQWNDFKLRMDEPDYPQLTLSLIAEYKHAHDELIKDAMALRDALNLYKDISVCLDDGDNFVADIVEHFDKKYPQANEKE